MDSDSELLRRYAEGGSEDAFRELVRLRLGLVYGCAMRQLGDERRAQDVAQEVFADLARKAPFLCRRPILVSWLYTSTHFATANLLRRERRQRARDHDAHLMQDIHSDSAHDEDWRRLRPVLDEELHGLEGGDRDAVLLRFFEGKSYSEVGESLKLSEDAARKRVDRALERLRVRLSGKGITSTSAALAAVLTGQVAMAAPAGLVGIVASAALTQSAGTAVTATGFLSSAAATAAALGVAGVLAIAAGGAAIHEALLSQGASVELSSLQRQYAASLRDAASEEAKVAEAEKSLASLGKPTQKPQVAAPTAAGGQGATSPMDPHARGIAFMARHPEVKAAFLAEVDAKNLAEYSALYTSLGLTPDEIQRMQVLLRFGNGFGRSIQSGTLMLSATDDSSATAYASQQAQLKALLGDDGYQLYQQYAQTVSARAFTTSLASLLADSDSPLTTAQAQSVASVLADSTSKHDSSQVDWVTVNAKAQGVLSSSQFAMLQNLETYSQGWQQVLEASH
jgi:RNA polymerase sigma factor (sigma-70 family)